MRRLTRSIPFWRSSGPTVEHHVQEEAQSEGLPEFRGAVEPGPLDDLGAALKIRLEKATLVALTPSRSGVCSRGTCSRPWVAYRVSRNAVRVIDLIAAPLRQSWWSCAEHDRARPIGHAPAMPPASQSLFCKVPP